MLRTLWTGLIALIATIPLSTATIVAASIRGNTPLIEGIIQLWSRLILWGAGIELRTENMALLDPSQRYVFVANHYSYFDIPCIFRGIPQPIRFLGKASLFKIPIFGWAITRAGFIPIDRKNRRTAVKSFDMAAGRIRGGNSIVVFPEEGRSRDGRLRPFQRGGFLLALKTQLPVVPVAIKGTWEVFRPGAVRVKPGPVTITVTPPIATAGLTLRDKERLAEEARGRIATILFGEA